MSRLTIAGGYVHEPADDDELPWHLVLFGRTKTDPRRYYYRRAEFSREASRSAQWHPWLKVDVQIDSDRVYPVVAFDRVFVFWATVEDVAGADSDGVVHRAHATTGRVRSPAGRRRPTSCRIYYSFYNLNKEWVPAQVLTTDLPIQDSRPISDVRLLVERRTRLPRRRGRRRPRDDRRAVLLRDQPSHDLRRRIAVALTPELYTSAARRSASTTAADRFTGIFDEPVRTNGAAGVAPRSAPSAAAATWRRRRQRRPDRAPRSRSPPGYRPPPAATRWPSTPRRPSSSDPRRRRWSPPARRSWPRPS